MDLASLRNVRLRSVACPASLVIGRLRWKVTLFIWLASVLSMVRVLGDLSCIVLGLSLLASVVVSLLICGEWTNILPAADWPIRLLIDLLVSNWFSVTMIMRLVTILTLSSRRSEIRMAWFRDVQHPRQLCS